jgi:hypothetical protein
MNIDWVMRNLVKHAQGQNCLNFSGVDPAANISLSQPSAVAVVVSFHARLKAMVAGHNGPSLLPCNRLQLLLPMTEMMVMLRGALQAF